jgi:hypothetical protein
LHAGEHKKILNAIAHRAPIHPWWPFRYPAPKKIVGYLEQEYESLDVGLQYLLKVASVLTDDTGRHTNHISTAFTQEMIRPMLTQERRKRHLTSELGQLCERGCLVSFSAIELREHHFAMARKIQAWQGNFEKAYVFESKILQRLIQVSVYCHGLFTTCLALC